MHFHVIVKSKLPISCPIEFKTKIYKSYVDDIFVIFQSRDHVKKFVDFINTKHPFIRFIFELKDHEQFFIFEHENYQKHSEKII